MQSFPMHPFLFSPNFVEQLHTLTTLMAVDPARLLTEGLLESAAAHGLPESLSFEVSEEPDFWCLAVVDKMGRPLFSLRTYKEQDMYPMQPADKDVSMKAAPAGPVKRISSTFTPIRSRSGLEQLEKLVRDRRLYGSKKG